MRSTPLLFVAAFAFTLPAWGQCSLGEVEVKITRFYDERRVHYAVVGELVNNCRQAAGAQVRFTARDAKGGLVDVNESWPASIRNIPAGGRSPFKLTPFQYDPKIKTVTAEVIDVRQWK